MAQDIHSLIINGHRMVSCPECDLGLEIHTTSAEESANGSVVYTYKCPNSECKFKAGYVYVPPHQVLLKALQKRIVQQLLVAIGLIVVTGFAGTQFGIFNFKSPRDQVISIDDKVRPNSNSTFLKSLQNDKKILAQEKKNLSDRVEIMSQEVTDATQKYHKLEKMYDAIIDENARLKEAINFAKANEPVKVLSYLRGKQVGLITGMDHQIKELKIKSNSEDDFLAKLKGQNDGAFEAEELLKTSRDHSQDLKVINTSDRTITNED